MTTIKLNTTYIPDATAISNDFFDNYMPQANGDFVKVYLYLLRCLTDPSKVVSVSFIADKLNITDNDVERALRYWASINLVELKYVGKNLTDITILPLNKTSNLSTGIVRIPDNNTSALNINSNNNTNLDPRTSSLNTNTVSNRTNTNLDSNVALNAEDNSLNSNTSFNSNYNTLDNSTTLNTKDNAKDNNFPEKKLYSKAQLKPFLNDNDISDVIFLAENYLGKTLNSTEASTLLYIYETLNFSVELIDYLIEYSVSKGTKSMRYIETVALAWHKEGITTVDKAKECTNTYSKNIFAVMKAFGLSNRGPGESEKNFIDTWSNEYGFSLDVIIEACNRTIQLIHQPSFEYADSILKRWKKEEVKDFNDIKKLDDNHSKNKLGKSNQTQLDKPATTTNNKFNKFPQRSYDYAELEKQLLNK